MFIVPKQFQATFWAEARDNMIINKLSERTLISFNTSCAWWTEMKKKFNYELVE